MRHERNTPKFNKILKITQNPLVSLKCNPVKKSNNIGEHTLELSLISSIRNKKQTLAQHSNQRKQPLKDNIIDCHQPLQLELFVIFSLNSPEFPWFISHYSSNISGLLIFKLQIHFANGGTSIIEHISYERGLPCKEASYMNKLNKIKPPKKESFFSNEINCKLLHLKQIIHLRL